MNNKMDVKGQLNRMKSLMKYGLNEGKQKSYNSVEYSKVAADGKLYGIVREGTKFYIKVSPSTKATLAESFDYIGGFRNRKSNEYSSFANAQKQFDLKMMAINEANKNKIVIESWNPDKKENLSVEATDKMKKEILRERQIMHNASMINEKKEQVLRPINEADSVDDTDDMEGIKKSQKNSIKGEKPKTGKPVGVNGDPFTEKPNCSDCSCCENINEESSEVLGWNDNYDYMDKSHGTNIGSDAPFDDATARNIDNNKKVTKTGEMKNGVVEEDAMHLSQDQNKPTPGVGEIGDDAPFDAEKGRQIDEAIDDMEAGDDVDVNEPEGDIEDVDGEEPVGDDIDGDFDTDDFGEEDDVDDDFGEENEYEITDDEFDGDINARLSALEDKLDMIADAVGADVDGADFDEYEDDDLYDEGDDDSEFDSDDEDEEIYESRAYRKLMLKEGGMKRFRDAGRVPSGNINKLDDFGKHPAYQKRVMSLPPKDLQEFPGYYDMNDDSVRNDTPYGINIGDSAPFDVDIRDIENAIAESIVRHLKKK